ncbi:MAG: hypothetical protein WCI71_07555 [Bacteroidota bacterium]
MKKASGSIFYILVCLTLIVLFSCKKSDSSSSTPRYAQLIGTWSGTTSQNQPIQIGIIGVDTNLYVTTYKYKVLQIKADTVYKVLEYNLVSPTFVTYIAGAFFIFRPYGGYSYNDYLKGTFDVAAMKLNGRFNTSFGATADSVTGTYTAFKVK